MEIFEQLMVQVFILYGLFLGICTIGLILGWLVDWLVQVIWRNNDAS